MTAEELLDWLPANYELSHDWELEDCWVVHRVNGGRNDREWTLVGSGSTPLEALRAAYNAS